MQFLKVKESERKLDSVLLSVNIGWSHEPTGKRGISHFLEHAVLLGNDAHPDPDRETAKYGVTLNGETFADRTIFFFNALQEDIEEILKILISLVFNPSFPPEKVEEEKNSKIIPAVVKESDYYPWEIAYEWAKNLIFEWDFMGSMGTKEELKNTGIDDLKEWHRKYYHGDNSLLLTTHPLNLDNLKIPNTGEEPEKQKKKYERKEIVIDRNLNNAEIVFGFPLNSYNVKAFLLSAILGNYPTSLFWRAFHRDAYMVESRVEWHDIGGLFLYLGANTKNLREIRKKFEKFIERLSISKEDLEIAKKILTLEIMEKERNVYLLHHFLKMDPNLHFNGFGDILEEIKTVNIRELRDYTQEVMDLTNLRYASVV